MMTIGQALDRFNTLRVLGSAWANRVSIDGNCEFTHHIVTNVDCDLCSALEPYLWCEVGLTLAGSGIEMFDLDSNATIIAEEVSK